MPGPAQMGQVAGAVDQIQEALAICDALEFRQARGRYLGLLCETQILVGAVDDALESAEQAVHANPDGLLYHPYALRLRGDLKMRKGRSDEARRDFDQAIEISRRMSAKSDQLRATISLARLLAKQGQRREAHAMLTDIYNRFTEGFDTADLKEAKSLLDELNL